jgi:hypothetical protein
MPEGMEPPSPPLPPPLSLPEPVPGWAATGAGEPFADDFVGALDDPLIGVPLAPLVEPAVEALSVVGALVAVLSVSGIPANLRLCGAPRAVSNHWQCTRKSGAAWLAKPARKRVVFGVGFRSKSIAEPTQIFPCQAEKKRAEFLQKIGDFLLVSTGRSGERFCRLSWHSGCRIATLLGTAFPTPRRQAAQC